MKVRKIALCALLMLPLAVLSATYNISSQITTILNAVTSTGAGDTYRFPFMHGTEESPVHRYVQASLGGVSAVSATAVLQCSADGSGWTDAVTITLTAASSVDGAAMQTVCPLVRGNVTAVSGTGATVTMLVAK